MCDYFGLLNTLEFVLDMISGYIRTQSYSIHKLEERETLIRRKAEDVVNSSVSWPKRILINWVLYHARRGECKFIFHKIISDLQNAQ